MATRLWCLLSWDVTTISYSCFSLKGRTSMLLTLWVGYIVFIYIIILFIPFQFWVFLSWRPFSHNHALIYHPIDNIDVSKIIIPLKIQSQTLCIYTNINKLSFKYNKTNKIIFYLDIWGKVYTRNSNIEEDRADSK